MADKPKPARPTPAEVAAKNAAIRAAQAKAWEQHGPACGCGEPPPKPVEPPTTETHQ